MRLPCSITRASTLRKQSAGLPLLRLPHLLLPRPRHGHPVRHCGGERGALRACVRQLFARGRAGAPPCPFCARMRARAPARTRPRPAPAPAFDSSPRVSAETRARACGQEPARFQASAHFGFPEMQAQGCACNSEVELGSRRRPGSAPMFAMGRGCAGRSLRGSVCWQVRGVLAGS